MIISLAVAPRFRWRGCGGRLLQYVLQELSKRTGLVWLQVRADNRVAVEFYEKRRFRIYSVVPEYYLDGEDILVMRRHI